MNSAARSFYSLAVWVFFTVLLGSLPQRAFGSEPSQQQGCPKTCECCDCQFYQVKRCECKPCDSSVGHWMIYVGVSVGVLVIIGVALALYYRRRAQRRAKVARDASSAQNFEVNVPFPWVGEGTPVPVVLELEPPANLPPAVYGVPLAIEGANGISFAPPPTPVIQREPGVVEGIVTFPNVLLQSQIGGPNPVGSSAPTVQSSGLMMPADLTTSQSPFTSLPVHSRPLLPSPADTPHEA